MTRDDRLLVFAASLLAVFVAAEVTVALVVHSLALLADAGHMVTDVVALAAAAVAARLARRPATGHWTFGLARAEVLSAAVNGITLGVIAVIITAEGIRRLVSPLHPNGRAMIIVGAAGLAVNLLVVLVLSRTERRSMNIAGAMSHVVTDAYGFAASIAAGAVIVGTGWRRADPVASLLLVFVLLHAARGLLRESGRVLLEAAPSDVDLALVREHLLDASYVVEVHDLHVWTVTSGLPALSVHVVITEECFTAGRAPALLDELQACLAGHFDVEHSTFQLEPAGHSDHEPALH
ncbi:MAG TPA: cation diffusion facilitator family transporter [Mycobacteriales bacterium]|nr:cation diffusion facilitator family transporter [Mycobacteriales bacterium]